MGDAFFSTQELSMLRLLVAGASNKEMARCFSVQEVKIKYHLSRLYKQMQFSNRAQAVAAAVNAGVTAASQRVRRTDAVQEGEVSVLAAVANSSGVFAAPAAAFLALSGGPSASISAGSAPEA